MRKLLSKPAGLSQHHHDGTSTTHDEDRAHNGHHSQHAHLSDRPSTSPVPLLYRPSGPQEVAFQVGVPIAALDKSPDGRAAVLAGRHVLKTVRVERGDNIDSHVSIRESFDLRALITAQASPRVNSTASIAEQLSIRDVKWGTGRNDTHIFTACLRGKIFQYDLSHLGGNNTSNATSNISFIQTQEDSRQINALDINPYKDAYLLSGSQDGMVRCFDTRTLVASRLGPTFRPMQAFKCNADVRAVQWSPKQGFYFACCTEQGAVMKWDIRKPSAPVLRITAHEKACSSLSWHPDGEHLLSGGVDKTCHVWDFSKTADKRQKPKWTLHTPASVAAVAWRPGQWSATCQGLRAAQVAVSYDVSGPKRPGINAAHVWDLARPTIPYKTVERFECSPSALLWKDQEFLWTAGEDGLFCQSDMAFAPRVIDRTAVSTLAFSSTGDVLTFLDERPPPPRPRVLASVHKDLPSATAAAAAAAAVSSSYGSDPTTPAPALSINQSDSEDDVVRGFLMPRRRNLGRKRRASSVHHLSSTPPSSGHPGSANSNNSSGSNTNRDSNNRESNNNSSNTSVNTNGNLTVSLEDSLRATGAFRPQQIMAIGHIPSAARKDTYGYLAKIYLETLEKRLPAYMRHGAVVPLPDRVASILDTYARAAENVSQFRLAQVWRILAFAMDLLFRNRAQYHKERRLEGATYPSDTHHHQNGANGTSNTTGSKIRGERLPSSDPSGSTLESVSSDGHGNSTLVPSTSNSRTLPVRSLLAEEIESTSNMPTPLARPVSGLAYLGEHYQGGADYKSRAAAAGGSSFDSASGGGLPSDIESFNLPPARYQDYLASQPRRRHLDSMPISEMSETSHLSSVEGYDFYDTEAMASAIDVPGRPASTTRPPRPTRTDSQQEDRSPVRAPDFHRQDSTDSAGGRIFEISQASVGHALDDSELMGAGGSSLTTTTTNTSEARGRGRDSISLADDSLSQSRSRGRQPEKPGRKDTLASSVGSSSRLLRLNRALLSMEFGASGSNPTLSTPGVTRDTYYRTNSQDTESSSNSFSGQPGNGASTSKQPTNSFTNKRPTLRRSASSRQDTLSVATSEFLPTAKGEEDDKDDNETEDTSDRLTDRDYLPWPHDPPFPFPTKDGKAAGFDRNAALNPYVIVERALSFEVRTSPLHASAMVLLLQPLMPDDVVDPLQARAILRQHHSRLMGMKLFLEAALLRNLCIPGWPSTRGNNVELSKWGSNANFTSIVAPAQKNVSASYICVTCKKPREIENHNSPGSGSNSESLWRCDRCKSVMAPCAVCGHRDIAEGDTNSNESLLSTWWYCVGCSHGGHLSCLEGWHSQEEGAGSPKIGSFGSFAADAALHIPSSGTGTEFSDGCCPLDGCGHACLPGQWRTETITQRSDEVALRAAHLLPSGSTLGQADREDDTTATPDSQRVRADGHEVGQSRAVDMVRESLSNPPITGIGRTGSDLSAGRTILSSSPGRSSVLGGGGGSGGSIGGNYPVLGELRERERRKSVKFAGTDDRG
ncbi:SEA (Seh1-associated) complex subunit [Sporothrix stenoceras]|uniref:SEA (Seh1-associated) complex subunit n=1 Tax=Sporothrix stenoceras TaxID=5173 RepID=A0ABR3ZML3_9PEZI